MENQQSTAIKRKLNVDRNYPDNLFPRIWYARLKTLVKMNGHTTERFDGKKDEGYVVSNSVEGLRLSAKDFYSGLDLEESLNNMLTIWKLEGYHGIRVEGTTVSVYISPAYLFDEHLAAVSKGKSLGRDYIFGLKNNVHIKLSRFK